MKFIFLDADGTLFHSDGTVPDSAVQAIAQAQNKGHKICLCTGRQKMEIYSDLLKIPFDAIIAGSGSDVYVDDLILAVHTFSDVQMHTLVPYLELHRIPSLYESSNHLYCSQETKNQVVALAKKVCAHLSKAEYEKHGLVQMVRNLRYAPDFYACPVNKITFLSSPTPFETIKNDLRNQFEVVPNTFAPLGTGSGEISSPDFDKATGMKEIIDYFHIDFKDTIAIGDGFNDLTMFKTAGIAVAMGNAPEEVQKKADFTTSDILDDGIMNAFIRLNLR